MTLTTLPTMDSESPLLNDYTEYNVKDKKSLGSLTFLAGCSLCFVSVLNLINVFSVFTPSLYLLNVVQGFFGFVVVVLEGEQYSALEPYSNLLDTYWKVLNLNIGKIVFFYFIALLSFVLTSLSVLYFPQTLLWCGLATVLLVGANKDV